MFVPVDQIAGRSFGHYIPEQLLGRGSLSTVYAAQQAATGRPVMLSLFTLPTGCVGRPRDRFIERFMQVASVVSRLNHPNIVPLYDFGEQAGYPYLVTPLSENSSLAGLLQKRGRCSPALALDILKQLAAGLDYAHQNNVVHGSLKPSVILVARGAQHEEVQYQVQIAGFGLARMLAMDEIGLIDHSHPHLFSIAGTLIANPMYMAPEIVQGTPADMQSDLYSLGIILFEMLTGRAPFTGNDPIQVAYQHVEQNVPSLLTFAPDLPPALDLILQRALERDPIKRLNSGAKLAGSFERVLGMIKAMTDPSHPAVVGMGTPAAGRQWIPMPGTASGKLPAVKLPTDSLKLPAAMPLETGKWPRQMPQFPTANATASASKAAPSPTGQAGSFANNATKTPSATPSSAPRKRSRRTLLVATGVVAVGALGAVGFYLKPGLLHQKGTTQNQPTQTTGTRATQPGKQPTPQGGIVLAQKDELAVNSSRIFVNPVDNKESLLVRLPNGDYVAYERACTHQGIAVQYDQKTHMLVCPKHHSIYDPAKMATVIDGPAPAPLKKVAIKVNAAGTVTTG